jgi:hypothetical protein
MNIDSGRSKNVYQNVNFNICGGIEMRTKIVVSVLLLVFVSGCEMLRFEPTEAQKQNAWIHARTTELASDTAKHENTSATLQQLTELGAQQSSAFVAYHGLPRELPPARTAEQILADSSYDLSSQAADEAARRPDPWDTADSVLELGIAVAGLLGGVYGIKAAGYFKQAREKSKALQEIVQGNELFKRKQPAQTQSFKQSHAGQSTSTKKIVAELRG